MQLSSVVSTLSVLVCGLLAVVGSTASVAADQQQAAPESAALIEARKKVKDINWEIGNAESALRQLSPPMRTTDSKGTTFNADKQRTYEADHARIDRQIRELKGERTTWELRVSQILLAQNAPSRNASVPETAPESAALTQARQKVKDLDWEIGQAESALQQLAQPVRISDAAGTTHSVDKQNQYEAERTRTDRRIRDLREERAVWALRVNQLMATEGAPVQR